MVLATSDHKGTGQEVVWMGHPFVSKGIGKAGHPANSCFILDPVPQRLKPISPSSFAAGLKGLLHPVHGCKRDIASKLYGTLKALLHP